MEALQGVNCIKGEIHSLITLLRLNTRWSGKANGRGSKGDSLVEEDPVTDNFRELNEYLDGHFDLQSVDCVKYVRPFYSVIVSEHAGCALTSAALSSLSKFALYGFFAPQYPSVPEAMILVAESISHCIFEETDWESDELILMKLLELATLCFRSQGSSLLSVESAWDVYSTCKSIYEHYRASKILKNEAETALVHLTLNIFARASHTTLKACIALEQGSRSIDPKTCLISEPMGITLMMLNVVRLQSSMLEQTPEAVKLALNLINVSLESGGLALNLFQPIVHAFCNDICRHLLRATQSDDLSVFASSLRVVFNLFMSMKDNMKVQLEVFLSSVHLRLLSYSTVQAKEELALESLLEFCREPTLMQDIYINYDCDVQCTNLFDTILQTLCKRATFEVGKGSDNNSTETINKRNTSNYSSRNDTKNRKVTIIHRLAFEGIAAILHSMALKAVNSRYQQRYQDRTQHGQSSSHDYVHISSHAYVESEDVIELEIDKWCEDMSDTDLLSHDDFEVYSANNNNNNSSRPGPTTMLGRNSPGKVKSSMDVTNSRKSSSPATGQAWSKVAMTISDSSQHSVDSSNSERQSESGVNFIDRENELTHSMIERAKKAEVLRKHKVMKQKLKNIAELFNAKPLKTEWLQAACDTGLITRIIASSSSDDKNKADDSSNPSHADAKSVAEFLKTSPGLGKQQIGEFISKGPADLFPFHAAVLHAYARTFNYTTTNGVVLSFDQALLRSFLSSFRLPGEAQCIDRIMEAFAGSYYKQLGSGGPFASADAVFILSFSTIMLNTDLHNPQVPVQKKMTKEQFVRNNRGINDGKDLPREYLESLYDQIEANQIQVQIDVTDTKSIVDFADPAAWHKLISRISDMQAPASFTPTSTARSLDSLWDPLTYDGDMFVTMSKQVFQAIFLLWDNLQEDLFLKRLIQSAVDFTIICSSLRMNQLLSSAITVFLDCSLRFMIQLRQINMRTHSKLNVLVNRLAYDTWAMEQNCDLSFLLRIDCNVLFGNVGKQNAQAANEAASIVHADWIESSLIKGEITLKMVIFILSQHWQSVHRDAWSTFYFTLLWCRSRGVLPIDYAMLPCSFSVDFSSQGQRQGSQQQQSAQVSYSITSHMIEACAPSLNHVYKRRSNGNQTTAAGHATSNNSSWFSGLLWSGNNNNAGNDVARQPHSTSEQISDEKLRRIVENANEKESTDDEGNFIRTDDWLLSLALAHSRLPVIIQDIFQHNSTSEGSLLNYDEVVIGMTLTMSKLLEQFLCSPLESLTRTTDRNQNNSRLPSKASTVLQLGSQNDDNSRDELNTLFPTQLLRNESLFEVKEVDIVLCLEWLISSVTKSPFIWQQQRNRVVEFLQYLLRDEADFLAKRSPFFLQRCVHAAFRFALTCVTFASHRSQSSVNSTRVSTPVKNNDPIHFTVNSTAAAHPDDMVWRLLGFVVDLPNEALIHLAGVISAGLLALLQAAISCSYSLSHLQWCYFFNLLHFGIFSAEDNKHAILALDLCLEADTPSRIITDTNFALCKQLCQQCVTASLPEASKSDLWSVKDVSSLQESFRRFMRLNLKLLAAYDIDKAGKNTSTPPRISKAAVAPSNDTVGAHRKQRSFTSLSASQNMLVLPLHLAMLSCEDIEGIWLSAVLIFADWCCTVNTVIALRAFQCLELLVCAAEQVGFSEKLLFSALDELLSRLPINVSSNNNEHPDAYLPIAYQSLNLIVHLLVVNHRHWREKDSYSLLYVRVVTALAANLIVAQKQEAVKMEELLNLLGTLFKLLRIPVTTNIFIDDGCSNNVEKPNANEAAPAVTTGGGLFSTLFKFALGGAPTSPSVSTTISSKATAIIPVASPHAANGGTATYTPDVPVLAAAYKAAVAVNPTFPSMLRSWDAHLLRSLQEAVKSKERNVTAAFHSVSGSAAALSRPAPNLQSQEEASRVSSSSLQPVFVSPHQQQPQAVVKPKAAVAVKPKPVPRGHSMQSPVQIV